MDIFEQFGYLLIIFCTLISSETHLLFAMTFFNEIHNKKCKTKQKKYVNRINQMKRTSLI